MEKFEEQIAAILQGTGFDTSQETDATDTPGVEEGKRIIRADQYTLPNGDILFRLESGGGVLIPHEAIEAQEANALDSRISLTAEEVEQYHLTHTPTIPLTQDKQEQNEAAPPTPPAQKQRRVKAAYILIPLFILMLLLSGTASYLYFLPLAASADITITPLARTIHKEAILSIATHPKQGQVQGRSLESISLTKSTTVAATGHGHDDARAATGEIVFYNTDVSPVSIPAGVTFSVSGIDIITSDAITLPAAKPPIDSQAVSYAHAIQTGSQGNIPPNAIYTHCCSASVIATNLTSFSGGQDAKDYSYVQSSDIANAAQTLLPPLINKATAALYKEGHTGESIVTPLCTPRTTSSVEPGSEAASVTVSVTQLCTASAYLTSSLNQTATSLLAHSENLTNYAQVGAVQVTVNGSTYTKQSAQLKVSLTGTWVYSFSPRELTRIKQIIAGMSKEKAEAFLQKEPGVQQVTVSLSRLDLKDQLPTDVTHIHILLIVTS